MTIGADGGGMHSLHAGKGGKIKVRLLKTSPTNALLQTMYLFQTASSANWGKNVMDVAHIVLGDIVAAQQVAFSKTPNLTYAKDGGMNEWEFMAVTVDTVLGALE